MISVNGKNHSSLDRGGHTVDFGRPTGRVIAAQISSTLAKADWQGYSPFDNDFIPTLFLRQ